MQMQNLPFEQVGNPGVGMLCLGKPWLSALVVLRLARTRITDEALRSLGRLTGLRSLSLSATGITNRGARVS